MVVVNDSMVTVMLKRPPTVMSSSSASVSPNGIACCLRQHFPDRGRCNAAHDPLLVVSLIRRCCEDSQPHSVGLVHTTDQIEEMFCSEARIIRRSEAKKSSPKLPYVPAPGIMIDRIFPMLAAEHAGRPSLEATTLRTPSIEERAQEGGDHAWRHQAPQAHQSLECSSGADPWKKCELPAVQLMTHSELCVVRTCCSDGEANGFLDSLANRTVY